MTQGSAIGSAASIGATHAYAKLPAQDVGRARTFYADKLGLQPFAEVHGHLHYEVAGVNFIVFPSTGGSSGTHDQFGFVVVDVKAEVDKLKSRGVAFESYPPPPGAKMTGDVTDLGAVRAAWFKDSEGNLISIAEFPTGSPFNH